MLCSSPRSMRLLPSSDLARFLRSRIMSATVMSAISRRMHKNSPAHTWTSQTPPMRGMVGGCTRRNGRTQCVHRAQSKHLKNPPRPRRREPLCTHKATCYIGDGSTTSSRVYLDGAHGDEMDEEHCEGEVQALLGSFHHHNQCHSPGLHSPVSCTRTPTPTGMRDRKTHPHAAAAHVHSVAAQPDADVKSTASAWNIVATVPPATWLPRISLHSHSHPAKLA